ncbi:MAG: SDR family NAD(P)-dependent oxidoreductase [Oscillatoriales cyanobacterium]|nr:MAG: SDR family NAD(P)-dependent oxidoreductase [Oscillatoriales cyanobacterium]
MISIQNQIVLITGASSGIGAACAKIFARGGAKLILAARRIDKLDRLAKELVETGLTASANQIYLLELDVRDRPKVESAVNTLPEAWKAIDILINNAGLSRGLDKLHEGNFQDWEEMIDTNVKGLLYMTRYIVPGMVNRGRGHIVNIGSIAGRETYPKGNVYCASKAAVKAISEGLKQDLLGTPVRVGLTPLTGDDVADVVYFCATRSPHVNISEILLVPTDQATATLVHRK